MVALAKSSKMDQFEYVKLAIENMYIDEDRNGFYGLVMSQSSSKKYRVHFIEPKGKTPHAVSCQCDHYKFRLTACTHMHVVNTYFDMIYTETRKHSEAFKAAKPAVAPAPAADKEALAEEIDRLLAGLEAGTIATNEEEKHMPEENAHVAERPRPGSIINGKKEADRQILFNLGKEIGVRVMESGEDLKGADIVGHWFNNYGYSYRSMPLCRQAWIDGFESVFSLMKSA